ncbi:hypothetical protein ACFVT2_36820 [Streptomyces sp. NPDC058000]|uniref:hypothetical protein n=1 Tax=Streptomyces sp. NPDC058000 TaxID=3346299 RepID=UPI0036EC276D
MARSVCVLVGLLQNLHEAARVHETEVGLTPVAVQAYWDGLRLHEGAGRAAFLKAQADRGQPLKQLALA